MQLVAGQLFGFSATVMVPKNRVTLVNSGDDAGVRVHLSSYLEPNDYNSVLLLSGMTGRIRLNPKKKIVNPKIQPCIESSVPLAHHEAYTTGLCQNECAYNFSMQECSCAPAGYLAQVPSALVCSPQKMLECVLPKLHEASSNQQVVP